MSKAFVNEDAAAADDGLPDRPIPPQPNLVTAEGLEQIQTRIAQLERELTCAQEDGASTGAIARDLRYWNARLATAQVAKNRSDGHVQFGSSVTLERDGGRQQTYRIVGIDEANPQAGTLSYISPLAQALLGREPGDTIAVGPLRAKIVKIA